MSMLMLIWYNPLTSLQSHSKILYLIRITVCGKLGVTGTILLYGNTAYGRGEVRWKYFKVKHPTLGMSAVQGEVKKMCIHDLPNIFGHRFVLFLTCDERAGALVDKPSC